MTSFTESMPNLYQGCTLVAGRETLSNEDPSATMAETTSGVFLTATPQEVPTSSLHNEPTLQHQANLDRNKDIVTTRYIELK